MVQSNQIRHLRAKFTTLNEMAKACGCTAKDIIHWDVVPDTGETTRMAGELPRWAVANLIINARYYGVLIIPEKFEFDA